MANGQGKKQGLGALLHDLRGWIVAGLGFVTSLTGFITLIRGNPRIVTLILLVTGIGTVLTTCFYVYFKHETFGEEFGAPQKRPAYPKRVRYLALGGLFLTSLLIALSTGSLHYYQSRPTEDIIILVAEFSGPDPENYRVTQTVLHNLSEATEEYPGIKVKALETSIDNSDDAHQVGEERNAAIVIWGWYGRTTQVVPISVNFEVVRPPEELPDLRSTADGPVQTPALSELESFELQTRLSEEMAYLSLFTAGMSHYAAKNWLQAINLFSTALNQIEDTGQTLDKSVVYYYRALCHSYNKNSQQAIQDFDQAIELDPDNPLAFKGIGAAQHTLRNYRQAIDDYNQVLTLDPDNAITYNNRGLAYTALDDPQQAIQDFDQAIELDPDYALAYNNRGNIYYRSKDYRQAINDYDQALALDPGFIPAYNNRGNAYAALRDYRQAIDDYSQALILDPNYTPAYYGRGNAYAAINQRAMAIKSFKKVLELTEEPIQQEEVRQLLTDLGVNP